MSATGKTKNLMNDAEKGITLLELCIVVLILGLIVTMAVPHLKRTYSSLVLKTETQEIVDQLYMINRRAVLSGVPWRFKVWPDGKGFFVERQLVEIYDHRPIVSVEPNWHTESRHYLAKGSTLNPVDYSLEWSPDGRYPDGKLALNTSSGILCEVNIIDARIVVTNSVNKNN
ncbi:MAG: hypothetical protein DWQ05_07730 [Calditrichaeota bacterium]|nr:MAG: hypothetical protein DWQ05_07730 [Calditrichota bacterium]